MDSNIIELAKLGHELAKELHCAESAALVRNLASQLEVQLVRSNALSAKLSMINGLMDAAEQANKLAQEATEKLVQERDALAAENAGQKEALWWLYETVSSDCVSIPNEKYSSVTNAAQVLSETTATDAFLAEVRNEAGARAVELFAQTLGSPYAVQDEKCYEDGFTRAIEIVRGSRAPRFAAQLRKGVQS